MGVLPESTILLERFAALDTLSGTALAIALAYMALPNLRYREQISGYAKEALRRIDKQNVRDEQCNGHYCRLVRFSGQLADDRQKSRLNSFRTSAFDGEDRSPWHLIFPTITGRWIARDTFIVFVIGILSAVPIILSTIEKADILGLRSSIFSVGSTVVATTFFMLLVFCVFPLLLIFCGRRWVTWAREKIDYLEDMTNRDLRANNITAEIPDGSPLHNVNQLKELIREVLKEPASPEGN